MAQTDKAHTDVAAIRDSRIEAMLAGDAALPEELRGRIVLRDWADSLVNHAKYEEPDPDYLSRTLLLQTLMAETPEAVLTQSGIRKLQESIPNAPGAGTGAVEVTSLYVTGSDFGEGAPCYMIFELTDLETGVPQKYSTGATQLQAQFLRLISLGVWPIRGQIKRTERKDRGGRFLFWFFPPD